MSGAAETQIDNDKLQDDASIPDGFHSITPHLVVKDIKGAIEFYKGAFNATEVLQIAKDEIIGYVELFIGNSKIMLMSYVNDPECPKTPGLYGGSPVSFWMYVADVDQIIKQSIARGATLVNPVENKYWGDRFGTIKDLEGYDWHIATRIEQISNERLKKRVSNLFGGEVLSKFKG